MGFLYFIDKGFSIDMPEVSISKKGLRVRPTSAREYYTFYLSQHSNRTNRRMHFIGTTIGMLLLASAVINQNYLHALYGVIAGYGMAWVGHFFVEKNKPATFQEPLYSFMCDYLMWWDIARGNIAF
eukprot:GDKK01016126.1.p2 GENE.GDKK01016126.1~~GDKK01016126.1.p2  ORF type:complete len:126 (+),score=15.71 GDKK01016126.1:1-378(+)